MKNNFKNELVKRFDEVQNNATDKSGFDFSCNESGDDLVYALRIIKVTDSILILIGGYGSIFQLVFDSVSDSTDDYIDIVFDFINENHGFDNITSIISNVETM